ncbi:MAG TPA: dipicolinate synthase subunit B [Firmicutes bacterium]|nr:dipicolinate synthase subunit B [Bacillota bacterium]
MKLEGKRVGFALCGSHCTLADVMPSVAAVVATGAKVVPILSEAVANTDTRFGTASHWRQALEAATGTRALTSIVEVEPIGPQQLFDVVVVAPCTGNTLAKIAHAITDSVVTMTVKAHLRNERPVVLAMSTNDGLGLNARNIGALLVARNVYFVPFGQDNPQSKPKSLVANMEKLIATIEAALDGRQIQPLLVSYD